MDRAADYELLSEAIDALDRLYDGDSGATEVRAILKVVGIAISDRELGARISSAAAQLAQRIRAASPSLLDNNAALEVTDEVRSPIAEAWSTLYAERHPRDAGS